METREATRSKGSIDFHGLWLTTGPVLWRSVYAYTGGRVQITEDAVAEAFARAMEHQGSVRDPAAWLFRTAFRIAAHELKREGRVAPERADARSSPPEPLSEVVSALRRLSPSQRAAVVMHYEADLPVREVGRRLGMSAATVKVHLFRGRRKLRELLGSEEVDDV